MAPAIVKPPLAWAAIGLTAWGVLTFGAVYPWGYWPLLAGSTVTGIAAIVSEKAWRDRRLRRIGIAILLVGLTMAIQLVLMPAWVLAFLSPHTDDFLRQFRVAYHPAQLGTLSLTPRATWSVLAEVLAFGTLFLGLSRLFRVVALDWLVNQLLSLATAVAVLGIVQKAFLDTTDPRVYGFWRPRDGGNPFGPFVNRNHFAGWMVMLTPVVAGYAIGLLEQAGRLTADRPSRWLRWGSSVEGNRVMLVASVAAVLAASLVLTGSRSGVASLGVAIAVLVEFVRRRIGGLTKWAAAGTLALVLAGGVVWAGADMVMSRFQRAPVEAGGRFTTWRDTWRIVQDFPVFGTGWGGYSQAMLVYQTSDPRARFAEAHNDYLQILAEGGVVGTAAVIGVVWIFVVGVRRRFGEDEGGVAAWIRRGAIAGLAGIAAQSLVEFSLQMPGNVVLFVVVAALAIVRPRHHIHAHRI